MYDIGVWLITAVAREAPTKDKLDIWEVVVAIGVLVGLIAGVQQIGTALRRRRYRHAEEKLLETASRALDAEVAERDVAKYQALRESLRRQVEDEVPLEGRRVYLRARLDDLRQQIGADVREYERLAAELSELEARPGEPLDARLRTVIEDSVRPSYVERRQHDRLVVVLLVILVLAALSPYEIWRLLFNIPDAITNSALEPSASVVLSMVTGAILVLLAARLVIGRLARPRLRGINPWPRLWLITIVICLTSIGIAAVGGLESNRARSLLIRSYDADTDAEEQRLEARAERAEDTSAILLLIGIVGLGLSAAFCLECVRLQEGSRAVQRFGAAAQRQHSP